MHLRIAPFVLAALIATTIPAPGQDASAAIPANIKTQHSTLYSSYFNSNSNLKDIARETQAGRDVSSGVGLTLDYAMDPEGVEESRRNPYPDMSLRGIACDADAIVVAVPKSSEAAITADGGGLFTDSRFAVESVLKNATTMQLEEGSSIIVTRPGGQATINGHSVRITVSNFPQFSIGHRYLLLLGHLPSTDTFEAFDVGSFELKNGVGVPFKVEFSAISSLKSEATFLTEVRAAATAPCAHQTSPQLGKHTGAGL